MLFSGGRIVVAAVGAIVLVIVAVYAVRSVWWDPTAGTGPLPGATAPTASSVPSASGAPDNSDGGASGGASGGGTGAGSGGTGGDGAGSSGAETTSETGSGKTAFTATVEQVKRFLGTVFVDVELPKVEGGDPAVASVFNDEMNKALQAQADSVTAGSLETRPGGGVRVGARVLSGVLRTAAVDLTTASSQPLASTVVVDSANGSIITLSSLFTDLDDGLAKLRSEAEALGPSTSLGSEFDTTKLQPTEQMFGRWSAETAGMKVFFEQGAVGPASAGVVELTIPWDNLTDVMKPGVADIVTS